MIPTLQCTEDLSSIPQDILDTMLLDTMLLDTTLLDTMAPAHLQHEMEEAKQRQLVSGAHWPACHSWLRRPMEDLVKTEKGMLAKRLNRKNSHCQASWPGLGLKL